MPLMLPDSTSSAATGACIVVRTREDMPADDQATLDGWLTNYAPSGRPVIAAWRIGQAIGVAESSVTAHRGRRCTCWGGKP